MHDDQAIGEQPGVPKDFRRQAHSFGAEGASRQEALELKLSTPDVKGQNLGEGQRDLPLVGVAPRRGSVDAQGGTVRYVDWLRDYTTALDDTSHQ